MRKLFLLLITLVFVGTFAGCTRQVRYDVQIDSITEDSVNYKKTYNLLPGNKDATTDDLYFKEYELYVHRALSSAGFAKSEGAAMPGEISIFLSYGISDPKNNIATSSHSNYGVTGKSTHIRTYTSFTRWMILDAYDAMPFSNERKLKQAWKTTVTSTGSSGDLRSVLPALAAASIQYIGKNTGKQIKFRMKESDPTILYVKGIQPP